MAKDKGKWALILGGSGGLGLATAQKLADHNFNLIILHRDRRSELEKINFEFQRILIKGAELLTFNVDATNQERQKEVLMILKEKITNTKISVLVHSIAKGNLKPMVSNNEEGLSRADFELTQSAMALSLYDWVKGLINYNLCAEDMRIIAFTSEGSSKVIPNYAAVALAKASLENLVKSMAVEFAPQGIKTNCIQAGVTSTKSFNLIPDSELIAEEALKRNPNKRLTTPKDVANAVYLLTTEEAKWITGNIIKVDGGESLC